jgi:hypothetical protein
MVEGRATVEIPGLFAGGRFINVATAVGFDPPLYPGDTVVVAGVEGRHDNLVILARLGVVARPSGY